MSDEEVANQLKAIGLPEDFMDFRVQACNSADVGPLASFSAKDTARAAVERSWWRRLLNVPRSSFAQNLANELIKKGFTQPAVAGYHGVFPVRGGVQHRIRAIETQGGRVEVRQSTVRRIFRGR
ncbi:hypothetical protein D3C77_612100 [compost metagenome]